MLRIQICIVVSIKIDSKYKNIFFLQKNLCPQVQHVIVCYPDGINFNFQRLYKYGFIKYSV